MRDAISPHERDLVVASLASDRPFPYNTPIWIRIGKGIDVLRMVQAAQAVVDASPYLWRRYKRSNREITVNTSTSSPRVESIEITKSELASVAASRRIGALDCDLLKIVCCRVADAVEDFIFINAHHAMLDGISIATLIRAVLEAYRTGEAHALFGPDRLLQPVPLPGPSMPHRLSAYDSQLLALRSTRPLSVDETILLSGTYPHSSFARELAVFALALVLWLDRTDVLFSIPVMGRAPRDLRALGNFAHFEHVSLNLDQDDAKTTSGLLTWASREAIRLFVLSASGTGHTVVERSQLSVVFDYKTNALLPEDIDPELDASLTEDPTYVDPKFDLQFSFLDSPSAPTVRAISTSFTVSQVHGVLRAYDEARRLLADTADVPIETSYPAGPEKETPVVAVA